MGAKIQTVTPDQFIELTLGNQFEIDVLGFAWKFDENPPVYATWNSSVFDAISRDLEGYDPSRPKGGLTEELFDGVRLYLNDKRLRRHLRLYIALGTSLDYWHGVDAFLCIGGSCVTLDITTNPTKKQKADFLLTPDDVTRDESGNPKGFTKIFLKKLAHSLVQKHRESQFVRP